VIPHIDAEIGISTFSTKFKGCGGKIREKAEDFVVSEILSKKTLDTISQNSGYTVYKLKKHNLDTSHALNEIFRKYRLKLKALGLKDAFAFTEQFVCSLNKSKSLSHLSEKKYSLEKIGFVKKPLSKKDMIGNNFKIKITDASSDFSNFDEYEKILNYFGYQRFGSKRPVTHLIGKEIIKKNYEKAIQILLSFTSKYDSKENTMIRKQLSDKSNFSKLVKDIPSKMDLEKIVVNEMIKHNDTIKALRALPINIRRFFIQAYQSLIFNKTLSLAFNEGENLFSPQKGDVCYDKNGILGKFSDDMEQRLTIPLVGYGYYKKTRFDNYISKILKAEDVQPKDFFLKEMQELSNEGGFRNSSINCQEFSISGTLVEFTLSRGSYATILMREIMKPSDPIIAGF